MLMREETRKKGGIGEKTEGRKGKRGRQENKEFGHSNRE